jgi:hypothetical protein
MPFRTPSLDNRNYADILRDALARIPVHNPEWTNFNDSDPGMTLLQLFAFMAESILYRANQIPERNRYKFLELLGIRLNPATPAKGFITINNERGTLNPQTVLKGHEVRAGQVRFRTTQGLNVLPIEARVFYKKTLPQTNTAEIDTAQKYQQFLKILETADRYREQYADLRTESEGDLVLYETTPLPSPVSGQPLPVVDLADTVDHCLWIALLSRPGDSLGDVREKIASQPLTVGVMPHLEEEGIAIAAGQTTRGETQNLVNWEIASVPQGYTETLTASNYYVPLAARTTSSILQNPSLVELTLPGDPKQIRTWDWTLMRGTETEGTGEYPPSLTDKALRNRLITWIRLRVGDAKRNASVKARISWVGINATMVQQQMPVLGEVVGTATGEPDQRYRLAHGNILPGTLKLITREPQKNQSDNPKEQQWHLIDDILAADPEVPINPARFPLLQSEIFRPSQTGILDDRLAATTGESGPAPSPSTGQLGTTSPLQAEHRQYVFTLDAESGEITFGDGAHGARPPRNHTIVADYAYGGGSQGNVGIGLIDRSPQLPAGFKVTNSLPTWGGEDAQDVASAEKTIPRTLQHRDRLVSVQDFEDLTRQTPGVDVGRVEIIPLMDPSSQNVLGAYFTAQIDLLEQIRGNQKDSDISDLLEKTQGLLDQQNKLIEKVIKNEATNEPFRALQQLLNPYISNEIPGAVTILVIPANPDYRSTPRPDQFFLEAVSDHLCPRRLVTTELHIHGPEYRNIWVSVSIKVLGGYALGPVREAVKQTLFRFLSPLYGWHSKQGWPLKVPVTAKELEAAVARVDGVRAVEDLLLGEQTENDAQSGIRQVSAVEIPGLRLPRLVNAAVAVVEVGMPGADTGTPTGENITPLEDLRRAPGVVPEGQKPLTPIPVLPERC